MKKALDIATETAATYSSDVVGTEHILYGMLKSGGKAGKLLTAGGATPEIFLEQFERRPHYAGVTPSISPRFGLLMQYA